MLSLGIILIKAFVLCALSLKFNIRKSDGWLLTLSLAQAGEFGFVAMSFAIQNQAIPTGWGMILSPVIAISMFLTPLLFLFYEKVIVKHYCIKQNEKAADDIKEEGQVIIAGIGRFGQIINRLLVANGFHTVVLDQSITMIERLKQINVQAYYGDASRPGLLHTAGIERASLLVIAIDDKEQVVQVASYVKKHFPKVSIVARAFDRHQAYILETIGVDHVFVESYYSALAMGETSLEVLGLDKKSAQSASCLYDHTEKQHHKGLLSAWRDSQEQSHLRSDYVNLFMELEKEISTAIKSNTKNH